MKKNKKVIFSSIINKFLDRKAIGARTNSLWQNKGSYIQPNGSKDLLMSDGSYINFGLPNGETGIGFRDNGGVIEYKNDGGAWAGVGGGGAGSGDVVGPTGAVDDNIATFNTTTGKLIQDGGKKVSEVLDRANHTGTQEASTISDFDVEVGNNASVAANTGHRGTTSGNPHNVTLSDVGGTTNHTALSNIGTKTHAEIDSHIADTDNPHDVVADQVDIADAEDYYSGAESETVLQEVGKKIQYTKGYDRNEPTTMPDIASSNTSRLVEVSVKSGSSNFSFYAGGKLFTKTTTQSVTIPDVTGSYFIYFDTSGVLQYVNQASIPSNAFTSLGLTALKRWNSVQGSGGLGDERHGYNIPGIVHEYLHKNFGATYERGFDINGLTSGGTTFSSIDSGIFWDEDIDHNMNSVTSVPTLYQIDKGEWYSAAATNDVGYKVSGDTYYSYNPWNETTEKFELKEGTSSTDYYIIFLAQLPSIDGNGGVRFLSQNAYSSRSKARDAINSEINKLKLDGLPSPEIRFTHAVIIKRDGEVQTLDDGTLFVDRRKLNTGGSGGLSGDSKYAADVFTDTSNFDEILSSSDSDVQTALETLNGERSSSATLTNKRINVREETITSSATPTPNIANGDIYTITALAADATFGSPTGTPTQGQKLMIRIKDNGTARTLAWNAIYRVIGVTLPATTVASKTHYIGAIYNSTDSKWDILAVGEEA